MAVPANSRQPRMVAFMVALDFDDCKVVVQLSWGMGLEGLIYLTEAQGDPVEWAMFHLSIIEVV